LQYQVEETARLRQQLQYQVDETERLRQQLQDQADKKFALLAGNAIIDLAKFVHRNNPSVVDDPSTHRLQQLSANATDKQLRESQIPTKYWPFIRNLAKVF
jgi:hypothetical protein